MANFIFSGAMALTLLICASTFAGNEICGGQPAPSAASSLASEVGGGLGPQAPTVGSVKMSTGAVFTLDKDGKRVPLNVGDPVYDDTKIFTERDGAVGIAAKDGSVVAAGPNSNLDLKGYFLPTEERPKQSMRAKLRRGTLAITDGDIARGTPEALQVETPTAIFGVRGTKYSVSYNPHSMLNTIIKNKRYQVPFPGHSAANSS